MSYTNVVFRQNIGRSVNRDQVERQRIDDRGNFLLKLSRFPNQIPNRRQSHLQPASNFHPLRHMYLLKQI